MLKGSKHANMKELRFDAADSAWLYGGMTVFTQFLVVCSLLNRSRRHGKDGYVITPLKSGILIGVERSAAVTQASSLQSDGRCSRERAGGPRSSFPPASTRSASPK